jgi:hypothetical protein
LVYHGKPTGTTGTPLELRLGKLIITMMKYWLPLEYPWKHPWDKLRNAEQQVTTGIPLEIPLGKLMKC